MIRTLTSPAQSSVRYSRPRDGRNHFDPTSRPRVPVLAPLSVLHLSHVRRYAYRPRKKRLAETDVQLVLGYKAVIMRTGGRPQLG